MSDETTPQDLDDTAGHVLHGDAAEHPTTGGTAPGLARAVTGDGDDTEGHMKTRLARTTDEDDDAEGHMKTRKTAPVTDEDGDDTDGHLARL